MLPGHPQIRGVLPKLLAAAAQVAVFCLMAACEGESATPTAVLPRVETVTPVAEASPEVGTPRPRDTETPPGPFVPEGWGERETLELYARVVVALLATEDTRTVYISRFRGEGERLDEPSAEVEIPPALLEYLPSEGGRSYELAEFTEVVGPLEDAGKVEGGGVFLTLGPVTPGDEPDVAQVRASIYRQVGSAEGNSYRFRRDPDAPGGWRLLEATEEWTDRI